MPQPGTRQVTGAWSARDIMTRDFSLVPPHSSIQQASVIAAQTDDRASPRQ